MHILNTDRYNYNNSALYKKRFSAVNFDGIVRPSKFIQTQGSLKKRFHVLWIDTKRNYCVYDYNNSGEIKKNKLLKNPAIKHLFDYFELKLKNFHKVSEKYYRGGAITCEYDILRLKQKGVTDIICLLETEKYNRNLADFANCQNIKYHCIPIPPPYGIPKPEQVNNFLDIISQANGKVYCHCLHGKDRTGVMTFIYEKEILGKNEILSAKNMVRLGFNVKKNVHIIDYLKNKYPILVSDNNIF